LTARAPILSGDFGMRLASRYRGKCFICGRPYLAGDPVWWSRSLGVWHIECELTPAMVSSPAAAKASAHTVEALRAAVHALELERAELLGRIERLEREASELFDALEVAHARGALGGGMLGAPMRKAAS